MQAPGVAVGLAAGATLVPSSHGDKVNDILTEVKVTVQGLKDKQEDMDGKMETMKKENEALWREVVSLRYISLTFKVLKISRIRIPRANCLFSKFTFLYFSGKNICLSRKSSTN